MSELSSSIDQQMGLPKVRTEEEKVMRGKQIRLAYGLPETATDEEVDAAADANIIKQMKQLNNLPETATDEELLTADSARFARRDENGRCLFGLPETATDEEIENVKIGVRGTYDLPETATDEEIAAAPYKDAPFDIES